MKVYISGKIGEAGVTDEVRLKFGAAEQILRNRGFKTFNPAGELFQDHVKMKLTLLGKSKNGIIDYDYILLLCFTELSFCDAIYLLDDYATSPGAQAELAFAQATGKIIYRSDDFFAPYIDASKELPFTVRRTFQGRRLPRKNISDDISDLKRKEIDILKKTTGGLDVYRLLWPDAARVIDAGDLKKAFKRRVELVGSCFFQLNDLGLVDRYLVMDFSIVEYPGYDCFEWVRREKGFTTRFQACSWIEKSLNLHASGQT